MSKEDLLKFANEKKPADFTKEFKTQLDSAIQKKLTPEPEVIEDDKGDDDKGDGEGDE